MAPTPWQALRAELQGAALLAVDDAVDARRAPPAQRTADYTSAFMRLHPTLPPYLAGRLGAARRAELEGRYWRHYYALADYLYRTDTQNPQGARAVALRELPNLRRALELALAAGETAAAVDMAASIANFLDNFGRRREREALLARARAAAEAWEAKEGGPLTHAGYLARSGEGRDPRAAGAGGGGGEGLPRPAGALRGGRRGLRRPGRPGLRPRR